MTRLNYGSSLAVVQLNTEALKAIREAGGDTQESLARRAGVTEYSYNQAEQGKTSPRVTTIRKFADALSVPVGAITCPDTCSAHAHREAS